MIPLGSTVSAMFALGSPGSTVSARFLLGSIDSTVTSGFSRFYYVREVYFGFYGFYCDFWALQVLLCLPFFGEVLQN